MTGKRRVFNQKEKSGEESEIRDIDTSVKVIILK